MSQIAKVLVPPQLEIVIPDFEKWYYSARFFNIKPAKSYVRALDVGIMQKVDLGIRFTLSGRAHLEIEICNNSPFPICLGGDIKFVESNCTNTFEATMRCGMADNRRPGESVSTVSGQSFVSATNSYTNGSSNGDGSSNGVNEIKCTCGNPCKLGRVLLQYLDMGDTLPKKATISFSFKFLPLESPCIAAKDGIRNKIQRDGDLALQSDMAALRKAPCTADVTIICNEKRFRAHKIILSARSSFFATMFSHTDFKENKTGEVVIPDCDEDTMEMFLKYVYEGALGKTTFEAAEALINIATKYDVKPLVNACVDIFTAHLREDNAIRLMSLCSLYNMSGLTTMALNTISDSKKPLKTLVGWEDLEQNQKLKIEIVDYIAGK